MTKKEKIILSSIIFSLGTVVILFFSATLHRLLSGENTTLTLIPLWECIVGLFTVRQQGILFLSFEGFLALCIVVFFIQNNRSYQSDLIKITEDIETPAPVGQHQHGSARWLKDNEKSEVFNTVDIDPHNDVISELLQSGYDNLDFLKQPNSEIRQGNSDKASEDTGPMSIPWTQKVDFFYAAH